LKYRSGTWWFESGTTFDVARRLWVSGFPGEIRGCDVTGWGALVPEYLNQLGVTDEMIALARNHVALLKGPWPRQYVVDMIDCRRLEATSYLSNHGDQYGGRLGLPSVSAYRDAGLQFQQRAPSQAEMAPRLGMRALYFFSVSTAAANPPQMTSTTLDVWFPFALDPNSHYSLWLGLVRPELRSVHGTLKDNVLHFDLPTFTLPVGVAALGEITGT
jgi:hypothetical protein